MSRGRLLLGGLGLVGIGVGAFQVLATLLYRVPALLLWLAGPLLVHDLLVAPAAVLLGWVGRRVLPTRARGPAALGLALGVTLVAITLPALLSPAAGSLPSLLERDYPAGLARALALVALITAGCVVGAGRFRRPVR